MCCFGKIHSSIVCRCLCAATLFLLLTGHVATLAYAYFCGGMPSGAGEELLAGGAALCSALPLLALGCLLPEQAAALRRLWLAAFVTYWDDAAGLSLRVLFETQVQPVVHALGLAPYAPPLEPLHYWWWTLQGLLLAVLARRLSARDPPCEDADESGDGDEAPEAVVVVAGPGCTHARVEEPPEDPPALLALRGSGPPPLALPPV